MVALLGDISVDVNPTPNSLEVQRVPSFLISSFPAQEKVVRNYSESVKLYTSYDPHLLKSRGFRKLVSVVRATQWEKFCKEKKKEKENDPCLSPPELSKQLYILFRDHTQSGWQEQAQQFRS